MNEISDAFLLAGHLLLRGDPQLWQIIWLSLHVSFTALLIATFLALPIAAALVLRPFFGRSALVALLSTALGLPPVVVGLFVYLALSRSGPLGELQLLFTPNAMIIAQTILIFPVITVIIYEHLRDLQREYDEQLRVLNASTWATMTTLLWEGRSRLLTACLAGLGRALSEVGAVILVGGNIANHTRIMTTAIALETSRGDLPLALALGFLLLFLALLVNIGVLVLRQLGDANA